MLRREEFIAPRAGTGNFFRIGLLLMALARRLLRLFLSPLPYALAITAGLPATALLATLTGPIPPRRLTQRPKPRRFHAGVATIPVERMRRMEPLPTSLQQTNPRTAMNRGLPSCSGAAMLDHRPRERLLPTVKSRLRSVHSAP